ncbi:MAG: SRPBCC family protein [Coriobacteriia bacterium]|nr:SRPBCC family protein [Coriobacteriia bacterium]
MGQWMGHEGRSSGTGMPRGMRGGMRGRASAGRREPAGVESLARGRFGAAAAALGGVALTVLGATRRTWWGKALAFAPAAYLGTRAVSMMTAKPGRARIETRTGGVRIVERVRVEASPQEVYAFFRKLENLPRFMHHTHDVREDADGRVHWVARVATGVRMEWDALLVDDEPGRLISWRSAPEEPFEETGTVRFEPVGDGTEVVLEIAYDFPTTPTGTLAARALRGVTSNTVAEELRSLKRIVERRQAPQPAGVRMR